VHSILRHVSEVTNVEFLSILEKISWPLYEDPTYNFHALKFQVHLSDIVI
jgi:hypothetical protein